MKIAEPRSDVTHEVLADVQKHLRVWRRGLLIQRGWYTLAAIAVVLLAGRLLTTPFAVQLQQVLAVGLVWYLHLRLSQKWRRLTPDNFLQHLNRCFSDFEESAQLLLKDITELTPLQSMQRERAIAAYRKTQAQVTRWQAPVRYRAVIAVCASCLLLGAYADRLGVWLGHLLPDHPDSSALNQPVSAVAGFDSIAVRITPPAYTGLAVIETGQLDLELPQGSRVEWDLVFDNNGDEYALQLSAGQRIDLNPGNDGRLHASTVVDSTDLYRIVRADSGPDQTIGQVYSLAVKLDRAPDIRMLEPVVTTLEIPGTAPPRFDSQALVKDDYAIGAVEILASVAKGSGEGVKFRDQILTFDEFSDTGNGILYQKHWDLRALGMEPGDEVYFTVIATDNRLPEANTGRSETLIVRWLDDQQEGLAADGLGIDFIPEFFKSQRQIIIETEQLIEDTAQLPVQAFRDSSYGIGQAQADLKQKYGQYLGDEFGEGPGAPADGQHEAGDGEDQHGDEHGSASPDNRSMSINSTADIIRFFGHDHGDPEIGPITQRNPVALMKRAVSEMWQAERHLMQAEPALALPYEYEAYKYLKLARQADRIYVKRLGFEPPPVSEDRRLSGKRDEILSYRLSTPAPLLDLGGDLWKQRLLKHVYQLLKTHSLDYEFNMEQRESLRRLSQELTHQSQQRPALIRHAANLEKLSLIGRLSPGACDNCLQDLETAIWNLVENSPAQFQHRNTGWYADDGLIQAYQRVLQKDTGTAADDQSGEPR